MDHLRQLSARYNAVWMETSQLYETWARRRGLSFYELLVVLSITETEEACSKRTFAGVFTIPKQTVHAIIKTLADKGWLELEVSEQDRRSRKLCLTAEGREQAAQIVQSLQEHEARVWAPVGGGPGGTAD